MKRAAQLSTPTAIILLLLSVGCDPEKAALSMFSDQGLTVLQPARDYIKPGGLVVTPKKGKKVLAYLDPYDDVTSEKGTYVDFKGVVQAKAKKQSSGIGVALGLLGQVVSLPIGLSYDNSQEVQLSQIDTSGKRMTTQMVSGLIAKKATEAAIRKQLKNNRVFVVQEIYTATNMQLSSTTKAALSASYGPQSAVPKCSPETLDQEKSNQQNAKQSSSVNGNDSSGAGTGKTKTPVKPTGAALSSQKARTSSTTVGGSNPNAPEQSGGNQAGKDQGATVGVCRNAAYSLSFTAKTAIPFAVRLNEIVMTDSGLDINYGSYTFPQTLGNTDVERATAFIDAAHPVISGLVHLRH
jgi:hypothetical protein